MIRFSRAELALFLVPVVLLPVALLANRWKVAVTPIPTPIPAATPTPIPNFFRGAGWSNSIPKATRDGKRIITHPDSMTSPALRFAVWDAKTGDLVRRFGLFRGGVGNKSPIVSPDGKLVLFDNGGYNFNSNVLLDVGTGRQLQQWKRTRSEGLGIALSNLFLAMPTEDDVRLYSLQTGALKKTFKHRSRDYSPYELNFSPDGKRLCWTGFSAWDYAALANGSRDNETVCFDVAGERKIWRRAFAHTFLMEIQHSGDGKVLIVRGFHYFWNKNQPTDRLNSYRMIWGLDAQTGAILWEKKVEYGGNEIPVSPDGKWIALALRSQKVNGDDKISICEARTGRERGQFFESSGDVFWSADSGQIWTSNSKRVVLQKDGSWSALRPIKPGIKSRFS